MVRGVGLCFRWGSLSRSSRAGTARTRLLILRERALPEAKSVEDDGFTPPRRRTISTEPYRYVLFIRLQGANETTWGFHPSVIVCRRDRHSCARSSWRYRASPSSRIHSGASAAAGTWPTVINETRHPPQHSHLSPSSPTVARRSWLVPLNESSSENFRISSDQPRQDFTNFPFVQNRTAF